MATAIAMCRERVPTAASFPGPRRFRLHDERGGPGIFLHVHDIKGRKVVERTYLIECGRAGAQNSKVHVLHVHEFCSASPSGVLRSTS